VLERVGKAAYKLQLPDDSLIHPAFHVSQLKQYNADYTPVFSKLPVLDDLSSKQLAPEAILERRLVKKANVAVPQMKVKWQALPNALATWEGWYVLANKFLGDKIILWRGDLSHRLCEQRRAKTLRQEVMSWPWAGVSVSAQWACNRSLVVPRRAGVKTPSPFCNKRRL
jgi:hypothetical protein